MGNLLRRKDKQDKIPDKSATPTPSITNTANVLIYGDICVGKSFLVHSFLEGRKIGRTETFSNSK